MANTIKSTRLDYLDNVKVLLTIFVIAVHAAVTYGSEGGWYYAEPTDDLLAVIPLTLLSAVFQSFFMSLFFFIAAFFTPASYDRKGAARFIRDRLIRLGIPCVVFSFGIGPLTDLFVVNALEGGEFSYFFGWQVGPLWFAQALLIFSLIYAIYRMAAKRLARTKIFTGRFRKGWIALGILGLVLSVLTFLARWIYPVGEGALGMQLGSFPQYIVMFVLGLAAAKKGWLEYLKNVPIRKLSLFVGLFILVLPVAMFLGADPAHGFDFFLGGPYWQSAVYSTWEGIMCVYASLLVLSIFNKKAGPHTRLSRSMSRSAFTVYIIHPIVLVAVTYLAIGLDWHPLLKFAIVLAAATAASFTVAAPLRSIPLVRRVV